MGVDWGALGARGRRVVVAVRKSAFARNVSVMVGGYAAGQVMTLLATPLVTRVYSPSEFGILSLFTAALSVLGGVASFRYEFAITVPSSEDDARCLLVVALAATGAFSVVTAIILEFWAHPILRALGATALLPDWWLIPLGVAGLSTYQVMSFWGIRHGAYRALASARIWQAAVTAALQLSMGAMGFGPVGLLAGYAVGQSSGTLAFTRMLRMPRESGAEGVTVRRVLAVAWEYRRFPLISTWSSLLHSISLNAPAVILNSLYGLRVSGQFGLAQRIMAAPAVLVGQAVGNVYLAECTRGLRADPESVPRTFSRYVRRLLAMGILPSIAVAIVGPAFFSAAFGSSWWLAGELARAMSLLMLSRFVYSAVSQSAIVAGRQDVQLGLDTTRAVLTCASLYIPSFLGGGAIAAVAAYSASATGTYALSIWSCGLVLEAVARRAREAASARNGPRSVGS